MKVQRTTRNQHQSDQSPNPARDQARGHIGADQAANAKQQHGQPQAGQRPPNQVKGQQQIVKARRLRCEHRAEQWFAARHRPVRAQARAAVIPPAGVNPPAPNRPVSAGLFLGLTVASIGGPLALVALQLPPELNGARSSAGLVTLMGTLAFLFPVAIWYRYSQRLASSGGLFSFVEAAVGRRLALVQAAFWIVSYFLYLVYTVPYIVYDLLPAVFPQVNQYRLALDAATAALIAIVMLSPLIASLAVVAAIAAVQVLIAVLLLVVTFSSLGAPAASFIGHGNLASILTAAGKTSSLYICASLPLFLAGEVRGGSRTVQ